MTVAVVSSDCIDIISQTYNVDKTLCTALDAAMDGIMMVWSYGITCARAYMRVDANDDDVCLRMRVCVCLRPCVCARV